ncbi:MAG: thermonuclease family protein, partial [Acetobacteraceae bacterium]
MNGNTQTLDQVVKRIVAAADAVRVIDGDTIVHRGQTIRIMGLDAPEVHHRCPEERALAERARA